MSSISRARERVGTPRKVLERHGISVRRNMACCPLHEDSMPSLSLFVGRDGRERWRCHGCGAGGDALDLEAALSGRGLRDLLR